MPQGLVVRSADPLRRIEAFDPDKKEVLVFLTNHLDLGATTIASIYKERWQIELFFKALKQNPTGTTVQCHSLPREDRMR